MNRLHRRRLIAGLLGWPLATLPGCGAGSLPAAGELKHTSFSIGHRIRDGLVEANDAQSPDRARVVIIGGGVAGLSAAWRLERAGFRDYLLLEMESIAGGTSRSGQRGGFNYPWGAHYIPVPMPHNAPLVQLLSEMGLIDGLSLEGEPIIAEQFLCRDPSERLFFEGRWLEGMYPFEGASQKDLLQLSEFRDEIDRWVAARDDRGRRMFAVPMAFGSDDLIVRQLDRLSMSQWMDEHGWDSPRLRWAVDYGCRDDYGLSIDRVSAWAGLFYFASRVSESGKDSQSVITWPEGNGRFIQHFVDAVGDQLRCGVAVCEVRPESSGDQSFDGPIRVTGIETGSRQPVGWTAEQVIFAAPQFLARHLIRNRDHVAVRKVGEFQYGSWLVANVHLRDRPTTNGFPMCWDNVIHDSRSLGYVTATHQMGIDHGPTVLTWYHPFADVDAIETRNSMLRLEWSDWAELVMGDLGKAHPDLPGLVTRLDVMLWGHAMVSPRVGFVWSPTRVNASKPLGSIHFAGTDLSGIALFEEAFYHGIRSAEEVLTRIGYAHQPMLPLRADSTS